ncbi:hypothetical protein PGTUg99_010325 [Puccinia graminis f. sp. tritici]|uniref:Uncharacterized protein n=1 Tax=Puccinia graminis f. sp. tritici TaxID=56615 RepID=A0A5B0SC35_PUCGR|nr:hypothetical protein PGTUg99_010325 [Puccinia graminis f. sp. tritici]
MPPRKSKNQNIIPNQPTTPNNNTPNSNANNSNPPNSNSNPPNSNSNAPNSNANSSNPAIPDLPPSEKPKRAPNFSPEEDKQLAKSWTVISLLTAICYQHRNTNIKELGTTAWFP